VNKWGKAIKLRSFNYISPARGRYFGDLNRSCNVDAAVAVPVTDEGAGNKMDMEALEIGDNLMDANQNVLGRRKRVLLPTGNEEHVTTTALPSSDQRDKSAKTVFGDYDILEPHRFSAFSQPVQKKQATGLRRGQNRTTKDCDVKPSSSRGRAGKKVETGDEGKRPRKPRKAKDGANTQLKLQFATDVMTSKSDYEDCMAYDPYAMPSSPENNVTNLSKPLRRHDRKNCGTDSPYFLPLSQRISSYVQPEQTEMRLKYWLPSSVFPPSQRSSRLFDEMMEQQSETTNREHTSQIAECCSMVELLEDETGRFVPRYLLCLPLSVLA